MKYNFDAEVSREGLGNLKLELTPEPIRQAGLIGFGGAEMDYPTFPGISERVIQLARNGLYGFTVRTPEYEDAVSWWMGHERGWEISPEWIVTAMGTIFSVATSIRLFTKPWESIIVQPPVYYRYEQAADRLGRRTIYNNLIEENGCYRMDLEDLERKMADPSSRLLVLCNPQNPVGRVWSENELREVGRLSAKYRMPVFSDEIFAETTFEGHRTVAYASLAEGREYAITCTSLGKTFNLTGVNHANVLIPNRDLRERFERQRTADHYGSIDPLAYAAVLGAYNTEGAEWVRQSTEYMGENVGILREEIRKGRFPGRLSPVEGTYVGWLFWDRLPVPDDAIDDFLIHRALVHMEAGTEYDPERRRYSRINLACSHAALRGALTRIEDASEVMNDISGSI